MSVLFKRSPFCRAKSKNITTIVVIIYGSSKHLCRLGFVLSDRLCPKLELHACYERAFWRGGERREGGRQPAAVVLVVVPSRTCLSRPGRPFICFLANCLGWLVYIRVVYSILYANVQLVEGAENINTFLGAIFYRLTKLLFLCTYACIRVNLYYFLLVICSTFVFPSL